MRSLDYEDDVDLKFVHGILHKNSYHPLHVEEVSEPPESQMVSFSEVESFEDSRYPVDVKKVEPNIVNAKLRNKLYR